MTCPTCPTRYQAPTVYGHVEFCATDQTAADQRAARLAAAHGITGPATPKT